MNCKRFLFYFLGFAAAIMLSSCFRAKDMVVSDDKYHLSYTLFDFKSWNMLDYETVGKTNPSETFDRMFSGLEILTQEFFENKKNGDKFRYCVVKIPDPMKESTIGDIFSDFEGAELGTVNGREWMTRGEPSYDGETFRIFGATRTAEYLYAIIYDTSDIKSSSRIARFLREITITDE